jgi:hypothetical protein
MKITEVKKAKNEDFDGNSGEARSGVVVQCSSTPLLQTSLLAVFLLAIHPILI